MVGPDELEDICQNASLKFTARFHAFKDEVHHDLDVRSRDAKVAMQHRRKAGKRRWLQLVGDDKTSERQSGPHPVPKLESREAVRDLDSLLSTLTEAKRAVFVLSDVQGCTNVEIAEILGINANTVRSRLHAARQELLHLQSQRKGRTP